MFVVLLKANFAEQDVGIRRTELGAAEAALRALEMPEVLVIPISDDGHDQLLRRHPAGGPRVASSVRSGTLLFFDLIICRPAATTVHIDPAGAKAALISPPDNPPPPVDLRVYPRNEGLANHLDDAAGQV